MSEFVLPGAVEFILTRLNERGYEAYVVGGCVRDHLMGRVPSDYDVTTNAKPHEMQAVFGDCRVVETGLKHGTLTVVLNEMNIEVTTYRVDGVYDDGRHPNDVTFTASLTEDLCRRDFTVNAIAYSPRDGFADPFDGRRDILRRRIACVGDPVKRFSEDALRILRAIRFSSTLDFAIDPATADAVEEMHGNLAVISRERIYQEMTKLLCGMAVERVMGQFPRVIAFALDEAGEDLAAPDVAEAACRVAACPCDPELRYAVLFCRGDDGVALAKRIYASLKPSKQSFRDVLSLTEHPLADTGDEYTLKKLMGRYGEDFPRRLIALRHAVGLMDEASRDRETEAYGNLRETNPCVTVGQLRVDGTDAVSAGLQGTEIGRTLAALLDEVMRGETANEREVLLRKLSTASCGKIDI